MARVKFQSFTMVVENLETGEKQLYDQQPKNTVYINTYYNKQLGYRYMSDSSVAPKKRPITREQFDELVELLSMHYTIDDGQDSIEQESRP